MINSKELGIIGEEEAIKFLRIKGYNILEKNWRYSHKEIDIIAQYEDIICIIEVKTRSSNYIKPSDAVTKKKQKHLIFAANEYSSKLNIEHEIRFDIIEVIYSNNTYSINYIKDAFYPTLN